MSDNLMSYWDPSEGEVVVAHDNGSEITRLDRSSAESFANEVLAASRGESTGYEDFLAQQQKAKEH